MARGVSGSATQERPKRSSTLTATVVICTYAAHRWEGLVAAVRSLENQTHAPARVIVVVDRDPALLERARRELPSVLSLENREFAGAGGARNSALPHLETDVVAFLDDDAQAAPRWLEHHLAAYDDPRVLGTAGALVPNWEDRRPDWFPPEFDWVVGCTFTGLQANDGFVRNPISANMTVRTEALIAVGGFRANFGKVGDVSVPEDTDLGIRILEAFPDRGWKLQPDAVAYHHVPSGRATFRYFCRRCWHEGTGKALLANHVGSSALAVERTYARTVLLRAVVRDMDRVVRHRSRPSALRAGAVGVGFALAALGYIVSRMRTALRTASDRVVRKPALAAATRQPIEPAAFAPLLGALSVLVVAVADTRARESLAGARPLFWLGYLLAVVPVTGLLMFTRSTRRTQLTAVISLAVSLYLIKVLYSPFWFSFHDEFGHWRTADAILATHHLYSPNPLLQASPFYPGLEIVTAALASLGGLSIFVSGLIVIGVAHVGLLLALYFLYWAATGSNRVAAVATCIYAANPDFLYFDAQFSYESLALAFGAAALLGLARRNNVSFALALLALAALVPTHHLTSYAIAGFLVAWGILELVGGRLSSRNPGLRILGSGAMVAAGAALWALAVASVISSYLGGPLRKSVSALSSLISRGGSVKKPFTAAPGYNTPGWEQIAGELSVVLLLLVAVGGLVLLVRSRPHSRLTWMFGGVALLYPVMLVPRLTSAGTEISNRSSEFVFLGLALMAALLTTSLVGSRADRAGPQTGLRVAWLAAVACVFVGGVTIGWAPLALQPGPYIPAANSRSIDAQRVSAASWARRHLPPHQRIATDSADALLMGSVARQNPQTGWIAGHAVSTIFTASAFSPKVRQIVRGDALRYLIVDRNLSRGLPLIGSYFYPGEPLSNRYRRPISRKALLKFEHVRTLNQIFTDGTISIYDAEPLLRATPVKPPGQ
jgi:GT2 family glycosyltransferase